MVKKKNENTNSFVKELKTRIELLNSSKVTANIDNSNYNSLCAFINKKLNKTPNELTKDDLSTLKDKDIKEILELCNKDSDAIDYIISNIEKNPSLYESILITINKYIEEYNIIEKSQTDNIKNKIELYQKVIDIIEGNTDNILIDDLSAINDLLETGFSKEDKLIFEMTVADNNLKLVNEEELNLQNKIFKANESVNEYLLDDYIRTEFENVIKDLEIDVQLIPTQAIELESVLNLDRDIINNMLCVAVVNNLYNKIIELPEEEKEITEDYKDTVLEILEYIRPLHNRIYYEAKKIIMNREEAILLNNSIDKDSVYEYLETPLSILEENTETREEAVNLKELAVIKPMIETIESLDNVEINSEEYIKYMEVLTKLVEQYMKLETKKEEIKQRIN